MSKAPGVPAEPTRRRMLTILAAAGAAAVAPQGPAHAAARFHEWSGTALGAVAGMRLWHEDAAFAGQAIRDCVAEVGRLESLFSLFRADSQVSRLNRDGALAAPAPEFVEILLRARRVSERSGGAFDVTVQPLWRLYDDHFRREPDDRQGPTAAARAAARALIGYRDIRISDRQIAFAKPGMALTLNGIAQGYITDRIADRLRAAGFDHVLVDLGELRALGDHPDGRPWQVGITDPRRPWTVSRREGLSDAALATSGGYAHRFGRAAPHHHLFDPQAGDSAQGVLDATVTGPRATEADALATALAVLGTDRGAALIRQFPGYGASVTRPDGQRQIL